MLDLLPIPDELMPHVCDIYPATVGQDADGAYAPTYSSQPVLQTVPCSAQPRQAEEVIDDQNRIYRYLRYHVFFNCDPGVSPRDKLIVTDSHGVTRTLFAEATRDEGGMGAYYVVRASERI